MYISPKILPYQRTLEYLSITAISHHAKSYHLSFSNKEKNILCEYASAHPGITNYPSVFSLLVRQTI